MRLHVGQSFDPLLVRFVYDLEVPSTTSVEGQEAFKPKPLDGEVEHFEVSPGSIVNLSAF